MTANSAPNFDGEPGATATTMESLRHGFQGNRTAPVRATLPASLTVTISREAGSRGASIARRIGRKLGWQVYTQELLDYIVQEGSSSGGVLAQLPPEAVRWAEGRLQHLIDENRVTKQRSVLDLVRVILALGSQGEAVLVGRGAGYLLPHETTLHVRIVAPLPDRVAYMSQWLRLTLDEAAEHVRSLDGRRAEFMKAHFQHSPTDVYPYDLLLNSSLLGEELGVALIVQAARAKLIARGQPVGAPSAETAKPAG